MSKRHKDDKESFIAIDPGILGTGVARFEKGVLVQTAVFRKQFRSKKKDWFDKAFRITEDIFASSIANRNNRGNPVNVVIEFPVTWGQSAKSHAAGVRGDLTKLSILIGMISWTFVMRNFKIVFIPPQEWKGQLSKQAVKTRITQIFKGAPSWADWNTVGEAIEHPKEHEADAIGLGLYYLGRF